MFCRFCGSEIMEGSKFCSNCGKNLVDNNPATNNEVVPVDDSSVEKGHLPVINFEVSGKTIDLVELALKTNYYGETKAVEKRKLISKETELGFLGISKIMAKLDANKDIKCIITAIQRHGLVEAKKMTLDEMRIDYSLDDSVRCPKCGSTNVEVNKKGFSGGKAIVGGLLTGGIGLAAGFMGKNSLKGTCLKCGHKWNI